MRKQVTCIVIAVILVMTVCLSHEASIVIRQLSGSTHGGDGHAYPATTVPIFKPHGFGLTSNGDLYFVEMSSDSVFDKNRFMGRIRCVHAVNKTISTILSNLDNPQSLIVDSQDNILFSMAHAIKKLSPSGQLTVIAGTGTAGDSPSGTSATQAMIRFPGQIWLHTNSDLYIADTGNNKIKKVTGGNLVTVAGTNDYTSPTTDGLSATSIVIQSPYAVTVSSSGLVYFDSLNSNGVKRVELSGKISTVVLSYPDGEEPNAFRDVTEYSRTYAPSHMFAVGETIYYGEQRFGADGSSKWFAGSALDSGLPSVKLGIPYSMIVKSSEIYFSQNHRISKISNQRIVTHLAGNGEMDFFGNQVKAQDALFSTDYAPLKLHIDSQGVVYVMDSANNRIRKIVNGTISTVVGNGQNRNSGILDRGPSASIQFPVYMATDKNNELFFTSGVQHGVMNKIGSNGVIYAEAGTDLMPEVLSKLPNNASETFLFASAFTVTPTNDIIIIASNIIRYYNRKVHTLIDMSPDGAVDFFEPPSLCMAGNNVIMADSVGNRILAMSTTKTPYVKSVMAGTGVASFCGDGGLATSACLNFPTSVACAPNGDIYIVDSGNNRIRKISQSSGLIETVVGNGQRGMSLLGAQPKVSPLRGDRAYVAIDPRNSRLYFSEPGKVSYLDSGLTCYGVDATNQTVCSGNGYCTDTDACSCVNGYSGSKCTIPPSASVKPVSSTVKPVSSGNVKPNSSLINNRANNSTMVVSEGNKLNFVITLALVVLLIGLSI